LKAIGVLMVNKRLIKVVNRNFNLESDHKKGPSGGDGPCRNSLVGAIKGCLIFHELRFHQSAMMQIPKALPDPMRHRRAELCGAEPQRSDLCGPVRADLCGAHGDRAGRARCGCVPARCGGHRSWADPPMSTRRASEWFIPANHWADR